MVCHKATLCPKPLSLLQVEEDFKRLQPQALEGLTNKYPAVEEALWNHFKINEKYEGL